MSIDTEYLAAVERGDMDTARRMVDEAAKKAADAYASDLTDARGKPIVLQHATDSDWNVYDFSRGRIDKQSRGSGSGIWLAPFGSPVRTTRMGSIRIKKLYAFAANALVLRDETDLKKASETFGSGESSSFGYFVLPQTRKNLLDAGYDAVIWNRKDSPTEVIVLSPSQIKSADPVTYDDSGNVIPLSKRFDVTKDDIRNPRTRSTPPQFPYEYAAYLKKNFPSIWAKGGNIRGNDTFRWWTAYRQGDRSPTVMHWWNVTRPAWIARHYQDHRLPGVIAQIKWGTVGTLGVAGMKRVVEDAIRHEIR
jgi:hypothetical protein